MRGCVSSSARSAHGARATMRPCRTPTPVDSRSDVAPHTVCALVRMMSPLSASITAPALYT